jgi:APA family basic amino acid/polyamine antiporter
MEISPTTGVHGIINGPALLILALLSLVLIKGTQESATLNSVIVGIKVSIVLLIVALGWQFINPTNYHPFLVPATVPGHEAFFAHGWGGVLKGAGIVFFAYIGFDAVSTAAQEARNPARDMPIGILGSLAICTVLYVVFGHVLTGICNWKEFKIAGKEASVAYAIQNYMPGYHWLAILVTVAILAGFSSVMLVMLLGQSRVFYSMSNDGLLPKLFSDIHPKFRTPYKSNILLFFFVGAFGAFIPGSLAGDLTSIGTLFAFTLVCVGVWILRKKEPNRERPFRTPLVPLVPILGMIVCGAMIISLDTRTQVTAFGWMLIGLVVFFSYSQSHSKLNVPEVTAGVGVQ